MATQKIELSIELKAEVGDKVKLNKAVFLDFKAGEIVTIDDILVRTSLADKNYTLLYIVTKGDKKYRIEEDSFDVIEKPTLNKKQFDIINVFHSMGANELIFNDMGSGISIVKREEDSKEYDTYGTLCLPADSKKLIDKLQERKDMYKLISLQRGYKICSIEALLNEYTAYSKI